MEISDIGSSNVPDVPHVPVDQIAPLPTSTPASVPAPTADLGVIIQSAKGRRIAYGIFAGLSALAGAGLNWCAVTNAGAPAWLLGVVSTISYLGGVFGVTAIANAAPKK
jgi:hypothetical protein